MWPSRNETGSGTVLTAIMILAITVVTVGLVLILMLVSGGQRARAAADLVAVSAALAFDSGSNACAVALETAQANQVELVECNISGDSIDFAISVQVRLPGRWPISGKSVAGHLEPE